jgi:glutamyl-Q tRNA(Asp) synthetase
MPSTPPYRGRFAPSPTGELHFGSLVAALGSWLRARSQGGAWLIRVEDLDPPREVPGSGERIVQALAAFGMASDEPIVRQGERGAHYAAALQQLVDQGAAFPCRCSRSELGDSGIHHRCMAGPAVPGREPAWRVRAPGQAIGFEDAIQGRYVQDIGTTVGDYVVKRADGWWAYQLAVVVDDAQQGITEVVRGADLIDSTPRQIHLQGLLGLPMPAYAHLPLALDASGAKLSKQAASLAVDPGDPLPALHAALAFLGQALPRVPAAAGAAGVLAAAARDFDLARVPRESRTAAYAGAPDAPMVSPHR